MLLLRTLVAALSLCVPALAQADDAEILEVDAKMSGSAGWTFSVTLRHEDTGWDDYADGWEVVDRSGASLGLRTLFHPHVEEQPITRSLSGIRFPDEIDTVFVRARTNTDGWGAALFEVTLPR